MGHKYSTDNTEANYNTHNYHTNNINDIAKQIGEENCVLFNTYPRHLKCKLCYSNMYDLPVIMMYCSDAKHRYHTKCMSSSIKFADNKNTFKCEKCRNILSKYATHCQEDIVTIAE